MEERLGRAWVSPLGLLRERLPLTIYPPRLASHRLANYLYPFLEAEVAAKGIAVVGSALLLVVALPAHPG